jgi:hypothetical protein
VKKIELSPSLVISTVALFVALSGGAYAALGPHSVGTNQLKSSAVTSRTLRDGAVAQSKIRAGAVGAKQIRSHSITAGKISGVLPGTLVAYAKVTPDGVDLDESWRITAANMYTTPVAIYCLHDLPSHRVAMVSPGLDGNGTVTANLIRPAEGNCSSKRGEAVEVSTSFSSATSFTDWKYEPFYIYLFK